MKKAITIGLGTGVGVALLIVWWGQHGDAVYSVKSARWGWLVAGLMCAPVVLWLQVVRTVRLVEGTRPRELTSAVLLSHGMNVLLPSLLGDAYEITAIARQTQLQARTILVKLIHRLGTTLAALGLLIAVALFSIKSSLAFFILASALALPLVVDTFLPRISQLLRAEVVSPLGLSQTSAHCILSLLQHTVSAAGVFCLGAAINDPVSPSLAAAMLSIADLVTYLPVPLGGVGVNHWGVTSICEIMGQLPVALVAFNHAMVVFVGGVSTAIGFATRPQTMHNG